MTMQNKTIEERRLSAAKGQATRRKNIEARELARREALIYADGLREEIDELEKKLAELRNNYAMNNLSAVITGKYLLRADEISAIALPWEQTTGVYFLIDGDQVVYVGQAVSVYRRIADHTDKKFDRYAFVPCSRDALDKLESLYIHCLRPPLNGVQANKANCAPISLQNLLGLADQVRKSTAPPPAP